MTQQVINIGAVADDGTGDNLRAAFGKANDNFTELYTAVATDPYPEVNTFADLPAATGSGDIYIVRTTTGVIGFRNLAGLYRDAAVGTWAYLGLYGRNAVEIVNVPAGTITSINVQDALNELDGDIQAHIGSGGSNHADASGVQSGFMSAANFTKLAGIATGATANSSDATLLNRANHTGTQGITSITMNTGRLLGRTTGASGVVEEIQIGSGLTLSGGVLAATGGGGGGSGDVVGPASATDLAIARYDSTTGKLLQDSKATVDDEGAIRTKTNGGANDCSVPLVNWIYQAADYALTNSVAEQKIFNQTTNGRLTLPTGVYEFDTFFWLTGMSATSGSAGFDPVGAGTAVCDQFAYDSHGLDNSTQPNAVLATSGAASVTQQSGANVVLAGTGTGMRVRIRGRFRITTAGTIIPSLSLVAASAATLKAGSYFRIQKIGASSENFVGAWD